MNPLRKLTALLAVIALMLTLWAPMAVTAAPVAQQEELVYFGRSILAKMDNGAALCYAYDKMVDACNRIEKSVDISHRTYRVTPDEVITIRELVLYDHPEFFWMQHIGVSSVGNVVTTVSFNIDENTARYRAAVDARVKELTVGLEGKSDYEKSLFLHDRVANAVDYQFSDNDQTVIGSLLEGASVCAGYAHAYQLLLQSVGIPSFYVAGRSKGQAHAWNLVQLDGDWYYTDVTWDDQTDHSTAEGGGVYYTYFNNTYAQMTETHTAEDFVEYLPKSTATKHNFYVKNGLVIDSNKPLDIAKLAKGLPATYPPQFYVLGDVTAGVQMVFNNLYPIAQTIAGKSAYPICTGAGMLDRGVILNLEIAHDHNYVTSNSLDPTCNNEGFASSRCKICGHVTKKTVPALGHHYDTVITDPTCIREGQTVYTCTACGDSYSEPIPATGEHIYDAVVTAPDCVNGGYTIYTCTGCGDSYVSDEVDALGHHYDTVITDPTCIREGQTVYTCTVCGDSYSEPIPATGEHIYDAVVTAPDCVNGGYTTYTCTGCGDSYVSDEVDALGHHYDTDCDADCNACGATREASNHIYDDEYDADCNVCGAIREVPEKPVDLLYGDLNGDGTINNRDLALLQQYINKWAVEIDTDAADVNKDGTVNNRDLALLQQYINKWDVTLG